MSKSNIWLIWLAVMWENLARNIASKWFKISVYNRTQEKTKAFIEKKYSENLVWTYSIKEFVSSLESPKKIMIMVKAWNPVDEMIKSLVPFLKEWDIIIDTWNSFYTDTKRRYEELKKDWINFIWCWVSGWEEWALKGPSIMPWGNFEVYKQVEKILTSIAANDFNDWKCVSYIWNNWAGHYVKMVHNGIEYAIMQMIAEWYDILRKVYRLSAPEIAKIFEKYNSWKLNSYLFEISSKVLYKQDEFDQKKYLVDLILDKAWSKWTGLWTSIEGLEKWLGIWTIIEATQSRVISSNKEIREKLGSLYNLNDHKVDVNVKNFAKFLESTLLAWMLLAYTQGLSLIKETSKVEKWDINLAEVTRIWQWGCIIRAKILEFLTMTFAKNNNFDNILELIEIKQEILNCLQDYKTVLNISTTNNVPTPSLSSWINYFYSITSQNSSANFIQWLRDYFWAHTYERVDKEWIFHTNWEN